MAEDVFDCERWPVKTGSTNHELNSWAKMFTFRPVTDWPDAIRCADWDAPKTFIPPRSNSECFYTYILHWYSQKNIWLVRASTLHWYNLCCTSDCGEKSTRLFVYLFSFRRFHRLHFTPSLALEILWSVHGITRLCVEELAADNSLYNTSHRQSCDCRPCSHVSRCNRSWESTGTQLVINYYKLLFFILWFWFFFQ